MDLPVVKIEKLIGVSTGRSASGVYSSKISFADGAVATLVSCILVKDSREEDVQLVARDIFEIANKKLEGKEGDILQTLAAAKDAGGQHLEAGNIDAAFAHIIFYKGATYVAKFGKGIKIFVYLPPKSVELTFETGSGPLKEGQLYLIATEEFISQFKPESFLQGEVDLEEIVDGLATEISALEQSSGIAAAMVLVKAGAQKTVSGEAHGKEVVENAVLLESPEPEDEPSLEDSGETTAVLDKKPGEETTTTDNEKPAVVVAEEKLQEEDVENLRAVAPRGESRNIGAKVFSIITSLMAGLGGEVAKLRRGEAGAIVRLRRNMVFVAVVFLLILAVSVGLTVKSKKDKAQTAAFNDSLLAASSKYSDGEAILGLNRDRARQTLIEADGLVSAALKIEPEDVRAKELRAKISDKLKETESHESLKLDEFATVSEPLVSLGILNKNLVAASDSKVYQIDAKTKKVSEIEGQSGTKASFAYNDGAYLLSGDKVYKVNLASEKSEKAVEGASGVVDISVFIGNIYLLSPSQIQKYVPIEGGYAQGTNYLEGSERFEVSSRFAIDGSVWVTRGNQILNYLRGQKQDFAISGLSNADVVFGEIYTEGGIDNLYVVDTENKALLTFGKDGLFKKAYQADDFGKVTGLVVDEEAGKIYVAVGDKILAADL